MPPVTVQVSVITGFEQVAVEEIRKQLKATGKQTRGAVRVTVDTEDISKVLQLRSIDNVYAIVFEKEMEGIKGMSKEEALEKIRCLMEVIDWSRLAESWKRAFSKELPGESEMASLLEQYVKTKQPNEVKGEVPQFRVTCNRAGEAFVHPFTSMEAAHCLGSAINNCFGWKPNMKGFDVEIVLGFREEKVTVMVSLNKESLFNRNIVAFGPTTMRSTMCYCMLALAKLKPGSIVLDAMCGGGSIPLEGIHAFNRSFFLGGEMHENGIDRCRENTAFNSESCSDSCRRIDFYSGDATRLPLRDNSVDAIVTDLPFGKRLGSTTDNRILYPKLLIEWSRVVCSGGIMVVMTHDRRSLERAISSCTVWRLHHSLNINQGGLTTLCARLINTKQ